MLENAATEFVTTLAGNGGGITASQQSFGVAAALPANLVPPFRAGLYKSTDTKAEIILVLSVSGLTWQVMRQLEQANGAPAAGAYNDGDSVAAMVTRDGLFNLGLGRSPASRWLARASSV